MTASRLPSPKVVEGCRSRSCLFCNYWIPIAFQEGGTSVQNPRVLERVGDEDYHYSTITQSDPLRPNTSGEYISSARAGGTTYVPGVVARAVYV